MEAHNGATVVRYSLLHPFPLSPTNLKRSFPRDFVQPDDRKRPLVQTGTVWKSFHLLAEYLDPLFRGSTRASTPFHANFLSRFPIQLLPSRLDVSSDHLPPLSFSLSLSGIRLESTGKKENRGKLSSFRLISLLSSEFPYFYPWFARS